MLDNVISAICGANLSIVDGVIDKNEARWGEINKLTKWVNIDQF